MGKQRKDDLLYRRCGFTLVLDVQSYKVILKCVGRIDDVNMRTKQVRVGNICVNDAFARCFGERDGLTLQLEEVTLATDVPPEAKSVWNELLEAFVRPNEDD